MKQFYLIFSTMIALCPFFETQAQTSLVQGDISIVGFNANTIDDFIFVSWVDLKNGTIIKFMDNGFNGATASTSANNLRNQEQTITWQNNTGNTIPAGTVIVITPASGSETTSKGTIVSTLNSVGTPANTMTLINNSGDQIFVFQSAGAFTNSATSTFSGTLLFGLGYSGWSGTATNWVTTGSINGSVSYLPTDLTSNNHVFFGPNVVAAHYTGKKTGLATLADYKALVANTANWTTTTGSTNRVTLSTSSFSANALPLDLISFTSQTTTAGNKLRWTTSGEINVANFTIEKASDGLTFSSIATVAGLNSAGQQQYQFIDPNSMTGSTTLYRLKMTDRDGTYKYSPIVRLISSGRSLLNKYKIVSNPITNGIVTIQSTGIVSNAAGVIISDANGRQVQQATLSAASLNEGKGVISVHSLPAGLYFLQIQEDHNAAVVLRFLKQ